MLSKIEKILLFLVVLFLPTQLGKHFWPGFSYIYSLKIDYLSPTIYFWDILTAGLLIVWILQRPKINKLALNLLLFFLFTQALSLTGVQNLGAGLVRLEQYTIAGFFGVYLASVIPDWKLIYMPLVLGILAESSIAVLQLVKGSTLGLWVLGERTFTISTPGIAKFDFYGYQFLRPYATFPHPNVLAGYMLVALVILIRRLAEKDLSRMRVPNTFASLSAGKLGDSSLITQNDREKARITMLWVLILLAGLIIFLTVSRTAILAGIVTAMAILRRQSVKIITFITIIIIIISPILFTRFSSLLNFDNLTFVRREELIESAWEMFLRQPLYGVGLNNFIPVAAGDLLTGPSRFLQPVHNIFLLTLSETGAIGLTGFIFLIGIPILSSLRKQGSINNWYRFRIKSGMTISWFIIIFLGMFDHYFLTLPQGYRLLFLVWGLSFSFF